MPASPHDFALVGGGIVGACLAEELRRQGASVLVLDAGAEAGHASARAAGVAVPSLRYLCDRDFFDWLRTAKADLEADAARLEAQYGAFTVTRPILRALRPTNMDVYSEMLDELAAGTWVDDEELASVAPDLYLPPCRRYLLDPHGLMVDGRRYLDAVRRRCVSQGVIWLQNALVREVREEATSIALVTEGRRFRADRVVITAGAWSSRHGLAEPARIRPQRGQMAVLRTEETPSCILSARFNLAPGVGRDIVVGATEEYARFADHVTAQGVDQLLRFATITMPRVGSSTPVEMRAGLSPISPTGRPLVGALPSHERVFLSTGHAGHGLLSARCTAKGLAEGLVHGEWEALPYSMSPTHALTVPHDAY